MVLWAHEAGKLAQAKDLTLVILKLIGPLKRRLVQTGFLVEAGVRGLIKMEIQLLEFTFLLLIVCLV